MSILHKIRSNDTGYKVGKKILSTPFLVNNWLYRTIYDKRIAHVSSKLKNQYPQGVDIGVTNACNADCIMCPHSKIKNIGTMKRRLYEKIIDNCVNLGIKNITLSFFGEPLMDPNLIEKIKYAKKYGLNVGFFTNASLLTKNFTEKIINSELDDINISFDGFSKKTYEKIRKNLKFDIVVANILRLIEMKSSLNSSTPKINLVLVELKENKNEIKKFYGMWKNKVDRINIITQNNRAGGVDKKDVAKGIRRDPCALLWQKMTVDWNGEVVLCCNDWDHQVILGNLNSQSIEEVWSGEKLKKIRELHIKRDFHKMPFCDRCNKKSVWWMVN